MNRVSHWMGLALIVTGVVALLVVGQAAPSDSRVAAGTVTRMMPVNARLRDLPERERFTLPEPPEVPEVPELPELPAVPEPPEIPEPRLMFDPQMRGVKPMRGANILPGVIVVLIGVYLILSRPSQTTTGGEPAAR